MQITTLIPAYKPTYLVELLNALRLQTVRPAKVIVSDDSPHGVFRETLLSAPYRPLREGLDLEVVDGPRSGAYANFRHLVDVWAHRSELVHLMLDDDVVYPEFYERHLVAHRSGDFSCSISRRWSASETGQPTSGQPLPPAVAGTSQRLLAIGPEIVFSTAVGACSNWFGEFSNAVFRADCADLLQAPALGGVSYAGLWDLGAFLAASLRRPVCHLQDVLGFFRVSAGQNSANLNGPIMKGAHLGYVALAVGGRRAGAAAEGLVRQTAALLAPALQSRYAAEADMAPFLALVPALAAGEAGAEDAFVGAWHGFLAAHRL